MSTRTSFNKSLREAGLTADHYLKAAEFFRRNGVSFAWVPKGFRFMLSPTGVSAYPCLIQWCGADVVRGYLDEPQKLFGDFQRQIDKLREETERKGD